MIGSMVEGVVQILFRVWTIGVFYFLNNRLFSWIKDSRTPKIPYQKMTPLPKKENIYKESKNFELCLINSRHYSWKNFIFMNLRNSQNQDCSWNQTTAMGLPYQKDSSFSVDNGKKEFSVFELFLSWNKHRVHQQETLDKTNCMESRMCCDSYSTDVVPRHSYNKYTCSSANLEFMEPYSCMEFPSKSIYQKEKEMECLKKEMYLFPPEKSCRRAESIDSGFQSFHNVNMGYTCVNTDGIALYISNVCHNKDGRVIAMTVGFAVEEDSSEESIFSDDEEDDNDELSSDEEDSVCCDSEEDFIVFDATECNEPQRFCPNSLDKFSVAVTLNTACPTVELKISQTFLPPSFFPCATRHEHQSNNFRCKKERKFKLQKDVEVKNKNETTELQTESNENCSAGTTDNPRKKVHFSSDVDVHRIITWDFAYRHARLGPWKHLATDRVHFQRKIDEIASVIEPVLLKKIALING